MVIWGSDLMYWLPVASQTPGKETHLEGIQRDTEIGMVESSFLSGEGKPAAQKCHFKLEQVSTSRTCQDTVRQELTAINQCSSKRTAEHTGFMGRGSPSDKSHLTLPYPNNCIMKINLSKCSGMPFPPVLLHWSWSNARLGFCCCCCSKKGFALQPILFC